MLSYALILIALAAAAWTIKTGYKAQETASDAEYEVEETEPELVQALARYETSQWMMAVATDKKMSQPEFDHLLSVLTNNIEDLERVA